MGDGSGADGSGADAAHVVLLHGLARSRASMLVPAWRLQRRGYRVHNLGYPSRTLSLPELAERVAARLRQVPAPFHVLTHSMGAIVLRLAARDAALAARIGRAVMLAPPNQGSEWVDLLGPLAPFGWVNGPAGRALATAPGPRVEALPGGLGPVPFACGVIAGTRPLGPDIRLRGRPLLPAPHDGLVSVASTRVEGMADHLSLPVSHTFIMLDAAVLDAAEHFLEHGRFAG